MVLDRHRMIAEQQEKPMKENINSRSDLRADRELYGRFTC